MKEEKKKEVHCPNCGAPVTTEICPYCNSFTNLDTKNADMEYPVLECKEAGLNFWNTVFPLIFAFAFGFGGIIVPLMFFVIGRLGGEEISSEIATFNPIVFISCMIPLLISIVAFYIAFKFIFRYLKIKKNGEEKEATVYGYMNDNLLINEQPAQIVKLLIQTNEGPRFILYQLIDTKKPYKINSKIKIFVYNDLFLIPKNKK